MRLLEAQIIAHETRTALLPFCARCEIAGSIRRQCPEVGDVEIVCIPSTRDLFGFVGAVNRWVRVKGWAQGRYTQRRLPSGMILDLFMATPENWGLILAIRTGSARFSHEVLARGWVKAGYKSDGGMLKEFPFGEEEWQSVPVREEADLFTLIGVPWVEPHERR